jgi:hypothetical protein
MKIKGLWLIAATPFLVLAKRWLTGRVAISLTTEGLLEIVILRLPH